MTKLLEVSNLSAFYGGSQALFDVNLTMQKGEVLTLLGRNGMGKSTTIKSICGLMEKTAGSISFKGHKIGSELPYKIAQMGIGLVPEGRRCFANLTVFENCIASARKGHWDFEKVSTLFPRLCERRHQNASTLSGGEQQMLAIARALMTNPTLLILDEATEGLAPIVCQEIWSAITSLSQDGLSILIVDKSLEDLRKLKGSCCIVEKGFTAWSGNLDDLDSETSNRLLGV